MSSVTRPLCPPVVPNTVRAVIFDLDNTLVDFMYLKRQSITAAAQGMVDAGLERNVDEIVEAIYRIYDREGMEYKEILDRYLVESTGELDPKILACGIVAYRRARTAHMVLYPHVKLTLMQLLKRGLRLAVLTDAPRQKAWLRLANLNLQHYFDPVITHNDTGHHKPHSAPFHAVLAALGLPAHQVMMVGDWPERDIEGARALGLHTALALYGSTMDTANHRADYELRDIADLPGVLDTLNGGHALPPQGERDSGA
ncbi:MAG: HAD-IA family hydrolase [Candidatus Delongbacteria bacterium]|nr:HAD-IA family hydrolase [Candidatus Cloacimonadota bacterium]MCB9474276.1 HAD-IA family hydrolase [Candidatus Delongbacteria bacterium]